MTEILVVDPGEAHESLDLQIAAEVGKVLDGHYPGHDWQVAFQGGVLVVDHPQLGELASRLLGVPRAGYVIKRNSCGTFKELTRQAVEAGGALLEMFGLPRGRWDGREPTLPSSIPSGWKRNQPKSFN